MVYRTIVLAANLAESSSPILEYVRNLAAAFGAKVILAHTADPLEYANISGLPEKVFSELGSDTRTTLVNLEKELLTRGIPSHSSIRQHTVMQLLLGVVKQYSADLLVLGTQAGQGTGSVLLGAVVEELVRLAPCPVLALASSAVQGTLLPARGGKILVPVENNASTLKAIATARELAALFGQGLLLVHARQGDYLAANLNPCAQTMEQIQFPSGDAQVDIRCLVRDGRAADVVRETAGQYAVSLIVLGVNRESRSGSTHGTAFEVLAESRVPVLCVPPMLGVAEQGEPQEVALSCSNS